VWFLTSWLLHQNTPFVVVEEDDSGAAFSLVFKYSSLQACHEHFSPKISYSLESFLNFPKP